MPERVPAPLDTAHRAELKALVYVKRVFLLKGSMSKDPAFLFYPGDWLGGTITFSRSHKGAYMDLLMAQFNQGSLSENDVRQVLGNDYESMWKSKLKAKFKQDSKGMYYNQRLEDEALKRRKYTESRNKNLKKDYHYMEHHMESHMENENIDGVEVVSVVGNKHKFIIPTIQELRDYCLERGNTVDPQAWYDFYLSKDWMIGKNKMKDWKAAVRTWESRNGKVDMFTNTQKANALKLNEVR